MAHRRVYEAVLISADGEGYITDYKPITKKEVIEKLKDRDSGWIFYPHIFIVEYNSPKPIKDREIIYAPGSFNKLKGKTVKEAMQFIRENKDFYF